MKMSSSKKPSKFTFTNIILVLSGAICLLFLVIAFYALSVASTFSDFSSEFYQASANISATLYNSMSPFIAIVAALLTFMAFWMQYNANQEMLKNYDEQKKNSERQEIEHQFYEMLRIHKENVKELKWDQWSVSESSNPNFISENESFLEGKFYFNNKYAFKQITGRKVFFYHEFEYCFIEYCLREAFDIVRKTEGLNYNIERLEDYVGIVKISYSVFYEGQSYIKTLFKGYTLFFKRCDNNLDEIEKEYDANKRIDFGRFKIPQNLNTKNDHVYLYFYFLLWRYKKNFSSFSSKSNMDRLLLGSDLCNGHIYDLNHYYRHLYQMVKIIANYNNEIVKKDEKRKYLRMLRAQLTGKEQLMLFYNWLAGYGCDWENNKNHFFTEFRMIHNINIDESGFFDEVGYEEIVKMIKKENPNYREYENDYLFEFEERMLIKVKNVYDRMQKESDVFTYDDLLPSELEDIIGRKRFFDAECYVVITYYKVIYAGRMEKSDYEKAITDIQNYIKQMFIWED
ncbi:putative phage abortive infection protein [Fibrobacter succinogenes]|uniref:putative phage abortive infection protein n=1 Tax=Fibrobacter succinogenes TaxID=833 RepID=UPI001569EFFB|nr:putative phage abortive infection protein [Fibrobacter succinogenes]